MKNVLTKISYMAFGCLLTVIGYHIGNVDNNSVNAQSESIETIDELRCRSLVIVDENDTSRVKLDKEGIQVCDEFGVARVSIYVRENTGGGAVLVLGDGPPTSAAAMLNVDSNGGNLLLWNQFVKSPVLEAVITAKGEGIIVTRDRAGDKSGFLGSVGDHKYHLSPSLNIPRKPVKGKVYYSRTDSNNGTNVLPGDVNALPQGKTLNKILRVGDRLVFNDGDINSRFFTETHTTINNGIGTEIIKFQNPRGNRSKIILNNGTVYIAPKGCEITNGVITKGEMEVYK